MVRLMAQTVDYKLKVAIVMLFLPIKKRTVAVKYK